MIGPFRCNYDVMTARDGGVTNPVTATIKGVTIMKSMLLAAGTAMLAMAATPANAVGLLDNYSAAFARAIDTPEASGVAYNWNTRTLMVANDEENNDGTVTFGEYDLGGTKTATIVISGCLSLGADQCDPEGLTYVGNGQYVLAEERYQDIALLSQVGTSGNTRFYTALDQAPTVSIGPSAGNSGLEGIAYDRTTGTYYAVKETSPQTVWSVTNVDFAAETATVNTLFNPASLNLNRLSDIAVLSNGALAATSFGDNLLILSGRSFLLLEVTKAGQILSSYDLSSYRGLVDPEDEGGKFEGLTLDDDGNIYLVSDDGDGPNQSYLVKLQYSGAVAVPEPSTWAMLIGGFGVVGGAMRRRQKAALAC